MNLLTVYVFVASLAATVWAFAAMSTVPKSGRNQWHAITFSIDAVLIITALLHERKYSLHQSVQPHQALYGWSVLIEALFILVAVAVLRRSGRQNVLAPVVALVVSLHFACLWYVSRLSVLGWLAIGLFAAATLAFLFAKAATNSRGVSNGYLFITGAVSAVTFWAVCIGAVWISVRP